MYSNKIVRFLALSWFLHNLSVILSTARKHSRQFLRHNWLKSIIHLTSQKFHKSFSQKFSKVLIFLPARGTPQQEWPCTTRPSSISSNPLTWSEHSNRAIKIKVYQNSQPVKVDKLKYSNRAVTLHSTCIQAAVNRPGRAIYRLEYSVLGSTHEH